MKILMFNRVKKNGMFSYTIFAAVNRLLCIMCTGQATLSIVFSYMISCICFKILPPGKYMYQQKTFIYLVFTIHYAKPRNICNHNLSFRNGCVRD